MPRKIARSAPQAPFGLPKVTVAVRTFAAVLWKGRKAPIFTPVRESIRGIPAKYHSPVLVRFVAVNSI